MTQQPLIKTQQCTVDRLSSTAFTVFAAVKLGVPYNNFFRIYFFKNKHSFVKRRVRNYQKTHTGEIKNKIKFPEDMGIKRTNLNFVCVSSDKSINEYETGHSINSKRKTKHSFEDKDKYLMK